MELKLVILLKTNIERKEPFVHEKLVLRFTRVDKTLVDSEVVIGKLLSSKYTTITTPEAADLIAINTCCFINEATQETESWIDRLIQIKRKDPHKTLVVLGCYPQRYGKQLSSKYPEVDFDWS